MRWIPRCLLLAAYIHLGIGLALAAPLQVASEPSACGAVENGLLVADDEFVGSMLFCPGEAGEYSACRVAKIERKDREGEPPSKLVALQDVEALATADKTVYVLGSHQGRDKGKRRRDREFLIKARWKKNAEELEIEGAQFGLLDVVLGVLEDQVASGDPLLSPAPDLSRVNLEGLAICDDRLFIGLRSPLDKSGRALILAANAEGWMTKPSEFAPDVIHVDLGGAGVRSLECSNPRLIILSGPESDARGPVPALFLLNLESKDLAPAPEKVQAALVGASGEGLAPEGVCAVGQHLWAVVAEGEGGVEASVVVAPWSVQ